MVPDAISTFSPYTPEALATAIGKLLAVPRDELTRGLAELRQRLSISPATTGISKPTAGAESR
jgi:hypothetical protein